jgi:hypothetical protein
MSREDGIILIGLTHLYFLPVSIQTLISIDFSRRHFCILIIDACFVMLLTFTVYVL